MLHIGILLHFYNAFYFIFSIVNNKSNFETIISFVKNMFIPHQGRLCIKSPPIRKKKLVEKKSHFKVLILNLTKIFQQKNASKLLKFRIFKITKFDHLDYHIWIQWEMKLMIWAHHLHIWGFIWRNWPKVRPYMPIFLSGNRSKVKP
jgi:hypothetical protein